MVDSKILAIMRILLSGMIMKTKIIQSSCRNFITAPIHWPAEVLYSGAFGSFGQPVFELAASRQASKA